MAVIFSLGEDVWPDVRSTYPASIPDDQLPTTLIFRTQKHKDGIVINDGPGDMFVGNPEQSAIAFITRIMPVWRPNKAHYYGPINEQDGGVLQDMTWLNRWLYQAMVIADVNGFKLAIPAFSTGNPRDGEPSLDPYSLEDRWHELLPALYYMKHHKHVLIFHEYGLDWPAANGSPATTLRASAPYLALRHRRSMSYLLANNAEVTTSSWRGFSRHRQERRKEAEEPLRPASVTFLTPARRGSATRFNPGARSA